MLQGNKQDSWSAAAFADPSDSSSQQQNLQQAGLTDQVLAGNLFGESPGDAGMGQPMNKADTGSQEIVPPVAEPGELQSSTQHAIDEPHAYVQGAVLLQLQRARASTMKAACIQECAVRQPSLPQQLHCDCRDNASQSPVAACEWGLTIRIA